MQRVHEDLVAFLKVLYVGSNGKSCVLISLNVFNEIWCMVWGF